MICAVLAAIALTQPLGPVPEPETPPAATQPADPNAGGEAEVMAAFNEAQAARGPLEGRWRLNGPDGAVLFRFQFADPAGQPDPRARDADAPGVEGVWLDEQRILAVDADGYIAGVQAEAGRLVLRFTDDRRTRTIELARAAGAWSGRLTGAGKPVLVTMTRD